MLMMHLSVNALTTLAVNWSDSIKRNAPTGIITLSSKLPAWPQYVIVASQPITLKGLR